MPLPILALSVAAALLGAAGETDLSKSPHARVRTIGMTDAAWTGGFWAARVKQALDVTLPEMWKAIETPGNGAWIGNLRIAAGLEKGTFRGNRWSDGDVYKWLESAALAYATKPDPALARQMDDVIAIIAKAQAPDGYISTNVQLRGEPRWNEPRAHEVYNMGHLFTAAAIHSRVTGKTEMLAVARRAADYLYGLFRERPAKLAHFSAPSNLMGMVELYRATGDARYLQLAGIFVDMRGTQAQGATDHFQDRVPLRKETEAVGHAVHATYLYSTAADIYAETGERALMAALERIWSNATGRKMYVTGAVGPLDPGLSRRRDIVGEAFGADWELPNRLGYNETCANIGNAMWNRRMLALTGEARYADLMELVLYNSMLSGIGLDGRTYFYANVHRHFAGELPLLRNQRLERWANTTEAGAANSFCCPPNLLRTILKTPEWAYGVATQAVWVNLYGASTLATSLPGGGRVKLSQQTDYPWEGRVRIAVEEAPAGEMALMLRIPGWAEGATARINGTAAAVKAGTYAELRRVWRKGDVVELDLPMTPRLMEAHPAAEMQRGQVAVMRGPLVYCLESPDLPAGVRVDEVRLPAGTRLEARREPALLGGVTVLQARAAWRRAASGPTCSTGLCATPPPGACPCG